MDRALAIPEELSDEALCELLSKGKVELFNKKRAKRDSITQGAFEKRIKVSQQDFSGRNLSGVELFEGDAFACTNFDRAWLVNARLEKVALCGSSFNSANMSNIRASEANLDRTELFSANMNKAILCKANLECAKLNGAQLIRANMYGAVLNNAVLSNADLSDARLKRAFLIGANITDAHLNGADFCGANVDGIQGLTAEMLLETAFGGIQNVPKKIIKEVKDIIGGYAKR